MEAQLARLRAAAALPPPALPHWYAGLPPSPLSQPQAPTRPTSLYRSESVPLAVMPAAAPYNASSFLYGDPLSQPGYLRSEGGGREVRSSSEEGKEDDRTLEELLKEFLDKEPLSGS